MHRRENANFTKSIRHLINKQVREKRCSVDVKLRFVERRLEFHDDKQYIYYLISSSFVMFSFPSYHQSGSLVLGVDLCHSLITSQDFLGSSEINFQSYHFLFRMVQPGPQPHKMHRL